jgi:hypothetical protein
MEVYIIIVFLINLIQILKNIEKFRPQLKINLKLKYEQHMEQNNSKYNNFNNIFVIILKIQGITLIKEDLNKWLKLLIYIQTA